MKDRKREVKYEDWEYIFSPIYSKKQLKEMKQWFDEAKLQKDIEKMKEKTYDKF